MWASSGANSEAGPARLSAPMRTRRVRRRWFGPDLDLGGAGAVGVRGDLGEEVGELRDGLVQGLSEGGDQVHSEQGAGRGVGQFDAAFGVEADDAGGDPGEDGFGEAAAFVDLAVGVHQLGALGGELAGHAVEGAGESGDLVFALHFGDADGRGPLPSPARRRG